MHKAKPEPDHPKPKTMTLHLDYERKTVYPAEYEAIIKKDYRELLGYLKYDTLDPHMRNMVRKAFELAADAHIAQVRKSGEPYILHPIAVSRICVQELGLGPICAVAALLHDVVEDTDFTHEDMLKFFGAEVAKIVNGLTKLDHRQLSVYSEDNFFKIPDDPSITDKERLAKLNILKIIKSLNDDPRIIYVKFADRLHNLRTIGSMRFDKRIRIAEETMVLYVPLAHRLGLNSLKTEMEDTCLSITNPEAYESIKKSLADTDETRKKYIDRFIEPLRQPLADNLKTRFDIYGRVKSVFSIHEKMIQKNRQIEEISDLFAIRVVIDPGDKTNTPERNICYNAYMIITDIYHSVPNKFKDYIASPKPNGYQSLHDVVFGPQGQMIEVQIRTKRMDQVAARGGAAHFHYKERGRANSAVFDKSLEILLGKIREAADNAETLDQVVRELYSKDITVYTPHGEAKSLPEGATVLDFAYSIHTDVGNHTKYAIVDGLNVSLNYKLRHGQVVNIKTHQQQRPTSDWLNWVITNRARNKIRQALREGKKRDTVFGRERLMRKLKSIKANQDAVNLDVIAKYFKYRTHTELLEAVQNEEFSLNTLTEHFEVTATGLLVDRLQKMREHQTGKEVQATTRSADLPLSDFVIEINNDEKNRYENLDLSAGCCDPKPRDPIFAYSAVGRGFRIHTMACPNRNEMFINHGQYFSAEWVDKKDRAFEATIEIIGLDYGRGVIAHLATYISDDLNANMRAWNIASNDDGYYNCTVTMVVENHHHYKTILRMLAKYEGITSVERVG